MEAYGHLRVLVSMILGLAITRVLSGLSRRIQQPARTEGQAAQVVWALVLLTGAVHFWWWEFALRRLESWHFGIYVFVLAYTSIFFLMATLIFPDGNTDHAETEAFFMRRRRGFYGLFALSFVFDFFDTALKGRAYLAGLGWEYPLRLALGVLAAALALRARSPRQVMAVGLAWLAYDILWILRHYDSLD